MPAYSFKAMFIPMLQDGSKTQTIRNKRKGQAKPGSTVYLYYGMRTKHCMKIGEGTCTKVSEVIISSRGRLFVNGKLLTGKVKNQFAWKDGFRPNNSILTNSGGAFELMLGFWKQTHSLPFRGDLIEWKIK